MAVGRGEFFQNYLRALERLPVLDRLQAGVSARPGAARGPRVDGRGMVLASRCWRPRGWSCAAARWSSDSGEALSSFEETTRNAEFPRMKSLSREILLESLPPEILVKILLYLDIISLLCIAQVSKLFHRLANDDLIWFQIYTSKFRSQMWKPKLKGKEAWVQAEDLEEAQPAEQRSAGHWKKIYFRMMAVHYVYKWRKELNVVSPYTGLPQQTEHVLRSQNVSWELRLRDICGQESRHQQNRAVFLETSLIVSWNGDDLPRYPDIRSLQLHAVHKGAPNTTGHTIPGWSSLLLDLDVGSAPSQFLGRGRLVVLKGLPHGVVVGTWRGHSKVVFIMISLHFHKLVERSLLGFPTCSYSETPASPLANPSDLQLGLQGYTLHFVLHSTDTRIMSGYFRQLSCSPAWIQNGLVILTAISRTNISQHRPLSGGIRMLWKNGELEGFVENCCFMTLTLLDEFQEPFWCESAPVCVTRDWCAQSLDYSGDHFLMAHSSAHGLVRMKLVWLKEQRQFFVVSLIVSVSVNKVNTHFGAKY